MKRVTSIFLLTLFLFNVGGYYVVFWGLQQHADQTLTARLDAENYNSSETVELKIPVTLPYPMSNGGFERVNGKFEHQGEFYKLVKQKLHNDTLYVVCIKDFESKSLSKKMTDYIKMSNDLPDAKNKALNLLGKLLKEYAFETETKLNSISLPEISVSFSETSVTLINRSERIPFPPPRTV